MIQLKIGGHMKKLIAILTMLCLHNFAHAYYVDSFKITLHKIAVSTNTNCDNMSVVVDHGNIGKEVDLINVPEFGRAQLSSGDYECVAFEVSKNFKFTPGDDNIYDASNNGANGTCVNGTESTVDMGGFTIPIIENYSYSTNCSSQECMINGTTGGRMTMWFQTSTDAGTCPNGSAQPFANTASLSGTCGGIKIANGLSVSSQGAGSFIVKFADTTKAIDNTTPGECNLLDVIFDFQ
jgi:hypothetical protein